MQEVIEINVDLEDPPDMVGDHVAAHVRRMKDRTGLIDIRIVAGE